MNPVKRFQKLRNKFQNLSLKGSITRNARPRSSPNPSSSEDTTSEPVATPRELLQNDDIESHSHSIIPVFDIPTKYTTCVRVMEDIQGRTSLIPLVYSSVHGVTVLSLKKDTEVEVWGRWEGGYWLGSHDDRMGLFPVDERVKPVIGERVRTIWSRTATDDSELSFSADQVIEVVEHTSNWWIIGRYTPKDSNGELKTGKVPVQFVEPIPSKVDENNDRGESGVMVVPNSNKWIRTPGLKVRATTTRKAQNKSDIDLEEGEIVEVEMKGGTTSYYGHVGDRYGVFPSRFVTENLDRWSPLNILVPSSPGLIRPLPSCPTDLWRINSPSGRLVSSTSSSSGCTRPLDIFPLFDAPTRYTTYVRAIEAISGTFPGLGEIYGVNGLRIKKGEVFEIWERWNGGYWLGSINGWCGLVPIDSRTVPLVGSQVRAIWARTAINPDELSFEAGQIINVVTQVSNWWIIGSYETPGVDGEPSRCQQGLVPFNFVETVPPEGLEDNISRISVHTSSGDPATRWIRTPNLQVRAQWSYKAPKDSDMDLQAGEIVTVTRKWSDTWYYGYTNERVGRFPAKYVTDVSDSVRFFTANNDFDFGAS
ncbi:hypothetical protein FRC19_004071 [Serendipita sp. 401]|nr:hypothetical protein FRC19_004071 [Serendipita sp. 401]